MNTAALESYFYFCLKIVNQKRKLLLMENLSESWSSTLRLSAFMAHLKITFNVY